MLQSWVDGGLAVIQEKHGRSQRIPGGVGTSGGCRFTKYHPGPHAWSRLAGLRYQDLTGYPKETLRTAMESLALKLSKKLAGRGHVPGRSGMRRGDRKPIGLPQGMCADFGRPQEKFWFNRKAPCVPRQPMTWITGNRHVKG